MQLHICTCTPYEQTAKHENDNFTGEIGKVYHLHNKSRVEGRKPCGWSSCSSAVNGATVRSLKPPLYTGYRVIKIINR